MVASSRGDSAEPLERHVARMSQIRIVRRQPEDADEIYRHYREVFGVEAGARLQARWSWQYSENPEREAEGPSIWVARGDRGIRGQYASMPVRLRWGDREVLAAWGMDVFVRSEARGLGVGVKLFTAWAEHFEVALGLGLTPSSYGLFQKLGFRDVGPVPFYQKILDVRAVASRRLGRLGGALVAPLLRAGLRLRHTEKPRPGAESVVVRRVTEFDTAYDALWERARASYAMCVRRDARYLQWKYVRCPHKTYDLWEARREEALVGFAVTRVEDLRDVRLGWIVDLFTDVSDYGARDALLEAALDSFRSADVARVQAFAISGALAASLRRRGFFLGRSPMQFCVQARVPSDEVFRTRDSWHVVFGDSDMDR
jgi:GNAT superfamily N-acetyltransferase